MSLVFVPGAPATVRRIDEEIEARPQAMRDLKQLLLMPGHPVRLDAVEPGSVRVAADAGTTSLDVDVATKVYVEAHSQPGDDRFGDRRRTTKRVVSRHADHVDTWRELGSGPEGVAVALHHQQRQIAYQRQLIRVSS